MKKIGLARGRVRLVAHQRTWARVFEREAKAIRAKLGRRVKDIQHVGSTVIPGVPAKPIIDIAILVRSLSIVDHWVTPLGDLGYWYKGKEPDMPNRRFFAKGPAHSRTIYLHVVTQSEFRRLVRFRDVLRTDRALSKEYAALKRDLAEKFPANRDAYTKAKDAFIRRVLET